MLRLCCGSCSLQLQMPTSCTWESPLYSKFQILLTSTPPISPLYSKVFCYSYVSGLIRCMVSWCAWVSGRCWRYSTRQKQVRAYNNTSHVWLGYVKMSKKIQSPQPRPLSIVTAFKIKICISHKKLALELKSPGDKSY